MDIEKYIKDNLNAERMGKNNAESIKRNYDNLLKFSAKFPKIICVVKESFDCNNSFWVEYKGPIVFDTNGKQHQEIIRAKDTPTISSICTILSKYLKYFCYLSNRESYFLLNEEEMLELRSLVTCLSVLSDKTEGIFVEKINDFADMRELFPIDEQGNLDFHKLEAAEIRKSLDSVNTYINYIRDFFKKMEDYGTLIALEDAEEFEKTIYRQTDDAIAIICDDTIDSKEKLIKLQEYKHFIKDIIYANVATLDNGKTIIIDNTAEKIAMFIGDDQHILGKELVHYCNEVLIDPRNFVCLLILFHIYRLDSTNENAKLLSEGFSIHLDANIHENFRRRFENVQKYDNPIKELCNCAKNVVSYFKKYENDMLGFEKEEYVEEDKLTGIWLGEKEYQYWRESGLNLSEKLFFYRDMDVVATKEDAKLIAQMSEKTKREQEEIERVNKIRTAVDKAAISLNTIFLLRQTLEYICNRDELIPVGMEEEINKLRMDLYRAETRIVIAVYKKKSILEEGRKKYIALDYVAIENSENKNLYKNVYMNEINLLKNMLKLSITDIEDIDEAIFVSKMNEYIRQAKAFRLIDEEIDEISKIFCDNIQKKVQAKEHKFECIYSNLKEVYRPKFESFRIKVQRYLGQNYTKEIQDKMESDFLYVLKALATGEYLYWKYVLKDNKKLDTIDYSCVALEYYLALETLANLYLYFPYYVKNFKGENWNDLNPALKGGGSMQHMTRKKGNIKENLEIGTLGYFYSGNGTYKDVNSGIMSCDIEYQGLKKYIEFFNNNILKRVYDECLSLKSISSKRNESAHGGKPLAATAAKVAQGAVYIHEPTNDVAFKIENVGLKCRKLAIEIFEIFNEV